MSLSASAVTALTSLTGPKALWHEFLSSYFDGASHAVGSDGSAVFPAVALAFGQGPIEQPLSGRAPDAAAEIRLIQLTRGESAEFTGQATGAQAAAQVRRQRATVLYQFQIRAKKAGVGQSERLADEVAQLLKAILQNPECRVVLAERGICHLAPQEPSPLPGAEYAMRLLHCQGDVEYEVKWSE